MRHYSSLYTWTALSDTGQANNQHYSNLLEMEIHTF